MHKYRAQSYVSVHGYLHVYTHLVRYLDTSDTLVGSGDGFVAEPTRPSVEASSFFLHCSVKRVSNKSQPVHIGVGQLDIYD